MSTTVIFQTGPVINAPVHPRIPGYEAVPFDGRAIVISPPAYAVADSRPAPQPASPSVPELDAEGARKALLAYCAANTMIRKKPAEICNIDKIDTTAGYFVSLETLFERRSVCWVSEPFNGGVISGPEGGVAPPAYQFDVSRSAPEGFANTSITVEIPCTAFLHPCHNCQQRGVIACNTCNTAGSRECFQCHGRGTTGDCFHCKGTKYLHGRSCNFCQGTGRSRCHHCQGKGRIDCDTCKGAANITCTLCNGARTNKHYLRLVVDWTVVNPQGWTPQNVIPEDKYKKAQTQNVYVDERFSIPPGQVNFEQKEVLEIANAHLNAHSNPEAGQGGRILRQRLTVGLIPLHTVSCSLPGGKKTFQFFAYGSDKKVYEKNYPNMAGCTIL